MSPFWKWLGENHDMYLIDKKLNGCTYHRKEDKTILFKSNEEIGSYFLVYMLERS